MISQKGELNVSLSDRPERENVIEKDEVLSLIIDVEVMTVDDFYAKYFSIEEK